MQRSLARLWLEDDGFVLSSEIIMYGTLGVIGVGAGYTALRDSVNSELTDVAKAIGSIDQSFWFAPVAGHSAWTAGSAFFDRADVCDGPQPVPAVVEHRQHIQRPLVCADVFGPGEPFDRHRLPPVSSRPRPDSHSLPGPDAAKQVEVQTDVRVEERHHVHHGRPHHAGPHHYGPQHFGPQYMDGTQPHYGPSKGVVIGDCGPARVVGAPGLVPAPYCGGMPVSVFVNPWQPGPYGYDVPEGFWNHGPGAWAAPPNYRVVVQDRVGRHDYGYNYAPAQPGVVRGGAETIDLGFSKVGDDELKNVEKFSTAKCLHVLGSNVTDKGLGYVAEMDQLESLHLIGTQVTDAGLKQLNELKKLRFLHLIGTKITDKGLAALAGMKQLEVLDVRGTAVTDEGLSKLQDALPTLRITR